MFVMLQEFPLSIRIVERKVHVMGMVSEDILQIFTQLFSNLLFHICTQLRLQLRLYFRIDIGHQRQVVRHRRSTIAHVFVNRGTSGEQAKRHKRTQEQGQQPLAARHFCPGTSISYVQIPLHLHIIYNIEEKR